MMRYLFDTTKDEAEKGYNSEQRNEQTTANTGCSGTK